MAEATATKVLVAAVLNLGVERNKLDFLVKALVETKASAAWAKASVRKAGAKINQLLVIKAGAKTKAMELKAMDKTHLMVIKVGAKV